ncbi:MAG: hypothetical protein JST00_32925 [Deltaproteobacteria bacterium]|nr:hypothetical protein [Deltaproteobacteria bacterium]
MGTTSARLLDASDADVAWVTRILPVVLGRRARGPGELAALANASANLGRNVVLEALMGSDEYVERWSAFMIERLKIGRDGSGWNQPNCYGTPLGGGRAAWIDAARIVRNHPPATPVPAGTRDYDMADVIRGAVAADDLVPVYRGFMFTLTQTSTRNDFDGESRVERGDLYAQTFLNRSPACIACHHSGFSTSGPARSWVFPGGQSSASPRPPEHESKIFPGYAMVETIKFQPERWTTAFAKPSDTSTLVPFPGWEDTRAGTFSCGTYEAHTLGTSGSSNPSVARGLLSSTAGDQTIWQLDEAFMSGVDGAPYDTSADSLAGMNGPRLAAHTLAAAFANEVWKEVMGRSLTLSNYLSRTPAQFGQLGSLASVVGLPGPRGRISLKAVLRSILRSAVFHGPTDQVTSKVFEPYLGALTDPDFRSDRIHRHSADVLFRAAAYALGKSAPTSTPAFTVGYPTQEEARALGMGLSPLLRAEPVSSVEGMLAWEHGAASCAMVPGRRDWIDGLASRAASDPSLTLRDVVDALKFRILSAPTTDDAERAAIAATLQFGSPDLSEAFATSAGPGARLVGLRRLCSVFMKTPDFMLDGAVPVAPGAFDTMRIQAGNLSTAEPAELTDETERDACLAWRFNEHRTHLGLVYECDPLGRQQLREIWRLAADLRGLCQLGRCWFYPRFRVNDPFCPQCDPRDLGLSRAPAGVDPRAKELDGGEPIPPFVSTGGTFLAYAPGATIVIANKALLLRRSSGDEEWVGPGATLAFGDSIEVPPGVHVRIEDAEGGVYETPKEGVPAAPDKGTWTFLVTGPEALVPPAELEVTMKK